MNSMDEYCAPQWSDFMSSPQVPSEDFFEKEHEVHERQVHAKIEQTEVSFEEVTHIIPEPETVSQTKMDTLQNIPVKVLSSISRNNNKVEVVQETTTYNDVLCEAMKNLQLSAKRNKCPNLTILPICQATTPSFKTPTVPKKRGTQSVGVHRIVEDRSLPVPSRKSNARRSVFTPTTSKNTSVAVTPKCNEVRSVGRIIKETPKDIVKVEHKEMQPPAPKVTEPENQTDCKTKADSKTELHIESQDIIESINVEIQEKVSSNIVTSFSSSSKPKAVEIDRRRTSQQRPRVLTCQFRRRSLAKYSRRSNQFVSMAEAVSKFQTGTPKRFRSTNHANNKLGPVGKLKQAALKPTIAISPVLMCKTRTRRVTVLSQDEREKLEMEEIKKHQIKANPIKLSALKGETILKKQSKKPTVPEPFQLTQVKKSFEVTEPKQEPVRKKPSVAKTSVPSVVSTSDSGIVVSKEKVLFFGVPADSNVKNRTHAIPFSFESRNREFQTRKEEKLKQLQLQESNKTKAEFHARPVPKYSKQPVVAVKEQNVKKTALVPCPFSFEQRDKNLLGRKEKLVQQVLEEDRKARVFHANPVPVFKPVMVRGTSKENLKMKMKEPEPPKKIVPIPCKKPIVRDVKHSALDEQENKEPNISVDPNESSTATKSKLVAQSKEMKARLTELNTDKRAKDRRAFDEKLKQKEQEEETKREKEEDDRLAKEKTERAELRKLAEVKANPMPVYKQLIPAKATKPLTNPQSPAWAAKPKAKHAV